MCFNSTYILNELKVLIYADSAFRCDESNSPLMVQVGPDVVTCHPVSEVKDYNPARERRNPV